MTQGNIFQVFHSRKHSDMLNSWLLPEERSRRVRRAATDFSAGERNQAVVGVAGSQKKPATAMMTVMMPKILVSLMGSGKVRVWYRRTFDDEEPLPSWDGCMVDLKYAERDQPAECTGKQCATEEQRDAEAQLATSVEQRKVKHDTREEASLESAEQEANDEHASEVVCCTLEEGHCAPANHH
jgi:hypothetical protein